MRPTPSTGAQTGPIVHADCTRRRSQNSRQRGSTEGRQVSLTLDDQPLPFNATPVFLGVQFDRKLTFKDHALKVRAKMRSRNNIMEALSGRNWGLEKEDIRTLFKVYICSVTDYCAAAYLPAPPRPTEIKTKIAQNTGARIITGCTRGTSSGLLNNEAGLLPIEEKNTLLTACAYDRALRLPSDNPSKIAALSETRQRLRSQSSWRENARTTLTEFDLLDAHREDLLPYAPCPPWEAERPLTINDDLNTATRRTDPPARRYKAAIDILDTLDPADIEIWTDGSAIDGCRNGGSCVYVNNTTGTQISFFLAAGKLCSSYRAEAVSLHAGTKWLNDNRETSRHKTVTFLTDSKSLVSRLKGGPAKARSKTDHEIWEHLNSASRDIGHIQIQWVPGHANLQGNEKADRLANKGSKMSQNDVPLDHSYVKAHITNKLTKTWRSNLSHDQLDSRGKAPLGHGGIPISPSGMKPARRPVRTASAPAKMPSG
jgi:ribonuclease HI